MRDRVPQKPPVYEAAGKIQPPAPSDSTDTVSFASAVSVLLATTTASYDDALSSLADLSHDIYYGVELTKSQSAINTLFNLMHVATDATQQKLAANILGHSVQNNPTALKELLASWEKEFDQPLGSALYNILKAKSEPGVMKAKIGALNGLVKDHTVRDSWLKDGGMDILLSSLGTVSTSEGEKMAVKLADFVVDNFLDEDMGAEKGVWPNTISVQMVGACDDGVEGRGMNGVCWEKTLDREYLVDGVSESTSEVLDRLRDTLGSVMGRPVRDKRPHGEL